MRPRQGLLWSMGTLAAFAVVVAVTLLAPDGDQPGAVARFDWTVDAWLATAVDAAHRPGVATLGRVLSWTGAWPFAMVIVVSSTLVCLLLRDPRRALLAGVAGLAVGALASGLQENLTEHNVRFPTEGYAGSRPDTAVQAMPVDGGAGGATHLFPSGHMIGATFDVGLLRLPLASWLRRRDARRHGSRAALRETVGDRPHDLVPDAPASARTPASTSPEAAADPSPMPKAAVAAWALAVLSCVVGRLVLRAHWPTDVLAGSLLGIGLLLLVGTFEAHFCKPRTPVPAPQVA